MCQEKELSKEDYCMFLELGCWVDYNNKIFKRNMYINLLTCGDNYFKENNTGIFATAYKYSSVNIKESFFIGDFYLDFDCKDDFEKVREDVKTALAYIEVVFKINPESVYIYFSGNKGVHIIIPHEYFKIIPSNDLNYVYKYIANNIKKYTKNKTVDLNIYDNKRLLRLPNSIHEKTNLYKIQITDKELKNLEYENILELAKSKREIKLEKHKNYQFSVARYNDLYNEYCNQSNVRKKLENVKHRATIKITPPCIKNILNEGVADGSRNNTIAVLSSFYKNKGLEMNKAYEYISKWNKDKNSPPSSEFEVERTIRSIYFGNYNYGCSTIKTLSKCFEDKCPMVKRGNSYARK